MSMPLVCTVALLVTVNPLQFAGVGVTPVAKEDPSAIFRYDWNRAGIAPAESNIVIPHLRWSFTTNGMYATRPLALDVNKDGRMEIFVGEYKNNLDPRVLYSLDHKGNVLWTFTTKWDVYATAVSDLDQDGVPEVVFSETAFGPTGGLSIYVANAVTGALKWSFTDYATFWEEGFFASPIVYDVDGDGVKDLTLGSMDRYVYTLSGKDGTVLWKSPVFEHYITASSPLVDLDGDGEKDFIAIDNHAIARAYSIKTHRLLWEQDLGYGVEGTPAIGDLNGDRKPEVVFNLIESGGVRVLRSDGSTLWNNVDWTYFYSSPALVDIDGDGLPDVVANDAFHNTVIAFRGTDGQEIWHTFLTGASWSQAALVVVDIDGDNDYEILAGSDAGLYSLDSRTGVIEWFFAANRVRRQPWVADIDRGGKAEILFGSGEGRLFVLDQAAEPRFEPRTIGYWKHQCKVSIKGEHVGIVIEYIDAIRSQSRVFSGLDTVGKACAILWGDYKSDMAGRAKQQLLALWLNVVSGFVDPVAPINLPKLTAATTVGGAILDAENLILTHTDKPSLERAKNICDSLNNGIR